MLIVNKLLPQGRGLAAVLLKRAASVELDWDLRCKSRFDATDSSGRILGVFLLRRGARLETVRARHFGSPSCKPTAGCPSGRRMAPRSTTNATAPSRPRCTAWCTSTQPDSSPTPKRARRRTTEAALAAPVGPDTRPDASNPADLPGRSLDGAALPIDAPSEGPGLTGYRETERRSSDRREAAKSGQGIGPDPGSRPSTLASAGQPARPRGPRGNEAEAV